MSSRVKLDSLKFVFSPSLGAFEATWFMIFAKITEALVLKLDSMIGIQTISFKLLVS